MRDSLRLGRAASLGLLTSTGAPSPLDLSSSAHTISRKVGFPVGRKAREGGHARSERSPAPANGSLIGSDVMML